MQGLNDFHRQIGILILHRVRTHSRALHGLAWQSYVTKYVTNFFRQLSAYVELLV